MTVTLRSVLAGAVLLLAAQAAPAAVLTPGTLYALVYDYSIDKERVVTVDPSTGAFTPVVAGGIDDCCLIGPFPVYALDANTGGFYAAGFLQSDHSNLRLLGFDAVNGTLATSPVLTSGMYQNNLFKLDVATGTLWGLVFDLGASEEQVVIVTPSTADRTAIGTTIANCCTIGGFNVSAFDPATGRLYVAGNLISDSEGSAKRLLGFDVLMGTLVSFPSLSPAWQYNDFELDPVTGTLYGIVFDSGTSKEYVVTVDPTTGTVTTVGSGIADCCTVSSFNAFDPYAGRLYIMGNLLSDAPASGPRLLGFDVNDGTLASSPLLPTGWNFNVLQVAVTPPSNNQPPMALCQDVEVAALPGQCGANASIDDGSFDPEGQPLLLSHDPSGPYPIGDTQVTLFAFDGEQSASCQATVTVTGENTSPTVLSCNSPATITPPEAPISFTASAVNACGGATAPTITSYDCWKLGGNGNQHPAGCKVDISGSAIEIANTGGVGTHIEWTVEADGETLHCEVEVVNPGH